MTRLAPLERIALHVIASLPDSFSQRKEILTALMAFLPEDHSFRVPVGEMLNFLVAHEEHQLNLPIEFLETKSKAAGDGDGKPNGETQP